MPPAFGALMTRHFLCFGLVALGALGVSACGSTSSLPGGAGDQIPNQAGDNPSTKANGSEAQGTSEDKPEAVCHRGTGVPTSHRAQASACSAARAPGDSFSPRAGDECTSDSQCTAGSNGRCLFYSGNGHCSYDTCTSDADCAEGSACECRPDGSNVPNFCIPSNCRVDADCGETGYCSRSGVPGALPAWRGEGTGFTSIFKEGYFCHTESDCCSSAADCEAWDESHPGACMFGTYSSKSRWWCGTGP